MVDVLTIKADDPDVLTHYHKQKLEFHFHQKSDNDFVTFLLDTAVRVISIVQHLAPVLEAVSAASSDQITEPLSPDLPSSPVMGSFSSLMDTEPSSPCTADTRLQLCAPEIQLSTPLQNYSETPNITPTDFPETSPSTLADFDKTISQLQQELSSVSQSLVTESTNTSTFSNADTDNISLIGPIQKDIVLPDTILQTNEINNISFMETIQKNMMNRASEIIPSSSIEIPEPGPPERITIKQEEENISDMTQIQTTERLQQLMSSLSNTNLSNNNNNLSLIATGTTSSLAPIINPTSTLSNIINTPSTNLSPAGLLTPILASTPLHIPIKKSVNPLSMLHGLQSLQNTMSNTSVSSIEQAAILEALYSNATEHNATIPGASLQTDFKRECGTGIECGTMSNSDSTTLDLKCPKADRDWGVLMGYIQSHTFPPEEHPHLQELWMTAVYENYKTVKNLRRLTAPQRYRLRKRFPIPQTISSTEYKINNNFAEDAKVELDRVFVIDRYPKPEQVDSLIEFTGLTRQQVMNYFKNKRCRS